MSSRTVKCRQRRLNGWGVYTRCLLDVFAMNVC